MMLPGDTLDRQRRALRRRQRASASMLVGCLGFVVLVYVARGALGLLYAGLSAALRPPAGVLTIIDRAELVLWFAGLAACFGLVVAAGVSFGRERPIFGLLMLTAAPVICIG